MRAFVDAGEGIAIVGAGGVALVGGAINDPIVGLFLEVLLGSDPDIAVLADGLVSLGLRDLPSFGVVITRATGSNVMVRRSVVAVATTDDGTRNRYDGSRVSTWVEDTADITGVVLAIGEPTDRPGGYWVAAGVVPAGVVRWGVESDVAEAIEAGQPAVVAELPATADVDTDAEPDIAIASVEDAPAPSLLTESEAPHQYDFTHLVDHTVYRSPGDAVVNLEEESASEAYEEEPATDPPQEQDLAQRGQATVAPDKTRTYHDLTDGLAGDFSPAEAEGGLSETGEGQLGDHDGFTVARRGTRRPQEPSSPVRDGGIGVRLTGVLCPSGHGNDPISDQCVVCGAQIVDHDLTPVERPSLGRLRLPSGEQISVSSPIVIGRNPVAVGLIRNEVPQNVVVDDELVSRNHAQLIIEGWSVLISDLNSTNQTTVVLPGQSPRVVSADESVLIVFGAEIYLGDYGPIVYEAGL